MTTKKTGGSQQPSKGRDQGRGHSKHTASTTPQQGTGEGGTRGTDKERHHAPRHAPPRHHTRRTHPNPRPQRVASGPRQPAHRAGSREGGAPEPRRPPPPQWRAAPRRAREPRGQRRAPTPAQPCPQQVGGGPRQPARRAGSQGRGSAGTQTPLTTAKGTPPGDALRHPHSGQRRPGRAHAVGQVLVPTPTPTAPGTHGSRNPGCPPQSTGGRGRDSA